MISRNEWVHDFLRKLGYPITTSNKYALVSWIQAEDGTIAPGEQVHLARYNPLNSTRKMPGSTDFNKNVPPVQNYVSYEQGLGAAVATLQEQQTGYVLIRRHLRHGDPAPQTLQAVEDSAWGTGGLALRVLPQVRDDYKRWADMPIGQ